ncbi:class C sortase [Sporofaciens sp. SGI.106]|uniref:class C sortase n=1 Tax=Sporofaciens sp. SGI.106 TaxID=3420568 RepID=UPI003CFBE4A8
MRRKKRKFITVLFVLVFLAGLSLILYPSVSNYWNSFHQSQAVARYAKEVAELDQKEYDEIWEEAKAYNQSLAEQKNAYVLTEEQKQEYEKMLDVSGLGVMGCVEIPKIGCTLPIYHGAGASVLQAGAGHLEWSSLPVGGADTHCVLSGHRGLPSAKLFTDLDKLTEGDVFMLRVLDEELTYEVDKILIVKPQEMSSLGIVEGEDYCTLVTCTPYGINTHRLLVRGHRVNPAEDLKSIRVTADAVRIEPLLVVSVAVVPILLLILIPVLLMKKNRRKNGGDAGEDI